MMEGLGAPGGGYDGMPEAWRPHGQLLDALHAALEAAERLDPLSDPQGLAVLDQALLQASQALAGLGRVAACEQGGEA